MTTPESTKERWSDWYCPHPNCHPESSDRQIYHEPISRRRTVCDKDHQIRLVWRHNGFHPRLDGKYRHRWSPHGKGWICPRCGDTSGRTRLPVFGCIADRQCIREKEGMTS